VSWRFPVYPIQPGYVLGTDQFNENFLCVTEEVSGRLNEHNFAATPISLLARDNLTSDAFNRLHYSTPDLPFPSVIAYTSKPNWVVISTLDSWQTFEDVDTAGSEVDSKGVRLAYIGAGGPTWICASFTVHAGNDTTEELQKGYGYLFALEVDGVIMGESLLGSGDLDQELYARGRIFVTPTADQLDEPQGGGGISGARLAIVLDAVVDLLPGNHVVKVAVMNLRGSMASTATNPDTYISTRELFALELLR